MSLAADLFVAMDDWRYGQSEEALGYVEAVLENVVASAAVGAGTRLIARPPFIERLVPVLDDSAVVRLWSPALEGTRRVAALVEGIEPNALGQYQAGGRTYVRMDGDLYEQRFDAARQAWRLVDQRARKGHEPLLRHNGQGAWLHEGEAPQRWEGAQLLRRLGHKTEGLSDEQRVQARDLAGLTDAHVRQALVELRPMDPILEDVCVRMRLYAQRAESDAAIEQAYVALPPCQAEGVEVIRHSFPGLCEPVLRTLVEGATDTERLQLTERGRVPLRVAQLARFYWREQRLSRACEGFLMPSLANADHEHLALGLLRQRHGWRAQTRIELRAATPEGPLLAATGAEDGTPCAIIIKSMTGYRPSRPGQRSVASLSEAILLELPVEDRLALDIHFLGGAELAEQLLNAAYDDRTAAAGLLGLRPAPGWFNPPRRLGTGSYGYPLSGETLCCWTPDVRLRSLYPLSSDPELRRIQRMIVRDKGSLRLALSALQTEWMQMNLELERWEATPAVYRTAGGVERAVSQTTKHQVVQRIRTAWRRQTPQRRRYDGTGRDYLLDLSGLHVGELPTLIGNFSHIDTLKLGSMELSGDISAFLGKFPNVSRLYLNNNQFAGLPSVITRLHSLCVLDASENRLAGGAQLAAALQNARKLQELHLASNQLILADEDLSALARHPNLERLDLSRNDLRIGDAGWLALAQAARLRDLDLSQNRITLSAAGAATVGRLYSLRTLQLQHNALYLAPVLNHLINLRSLNLSYTRLSVWPPGLGALMNRSEALNLRAVDLAGNQIVEVPLIHSSAFIQRRESTFGRDHYRLNINDNPLSEASLRRLALAHVPARRSLGPIANPLDWLTGAPPELQEQVEQARREPDTRAFIDALDRVVETAEFMSDIEEGRRRMWNVARMALDMVEEPDQLGGAALRDQLLTLASDATQTCGDGVALILNQMETLIEAWRAATSAQGPGDELLSAIIGASEQMFRLALVDDLGTRIAQKRMERRAALYFGIETTPGSPLHPLDDIGEGSLLLPVDEAEIRLLMRRSLANRLDLPPQPRAMLYGEHLTHATLDRVAEEVLKQATQPALSDWLVAQGFWRHYLMSALAEQFDPLEDIWNAGSGYLYDARNADTELDPSLPAQVVEALTEVAPAVGWTVEGVPQHVELDSQTYKAAFDALQRGREKAIAAVVRQQTDRLVAEYSALPEEAE